MPFRVIDQTKPIETICKFVNDCNGSFLALFCKLFFDDSFSKNLFWRIIHLKIVNYIRVSRSLAFDVFLDEMFVTEVEHPPPLLAPAEGSSA